MSMPLGMSRSEVHLLEQQLERIQYVPQNEFRSGELEIRAAWIDRYDGRNNRLYMMLRNRATKNAVWIPFENAWLFNEKGAENSDAVRDYAMTLYGPMSSNQDRYRILSIILGCIGDIQRSKPAPATTMEELLRGAGAESVTINADGQTVGKMELN